MRAGREPAVGAARARRVRPSFPGAPWWVAVPAVAVLAASVAVFTLPGISSRSYACADCGASQRRTRVLFVSFADDRTAGPGQRLRERVLGPCTEHRWRAGGCERSFSVISCGPSELPPPDWDVCARAEIPSSAELVRHVAAMSVGERERLWDSIASRRGWAEPESTDDARRWVASMARAKGWTDLDVETWEPARSPLGR